MGPSVRSEIILKPTVSAPEAVAERTTASTQLLRPLENARPVGRAEIAQLLREFRENVIAKEMDGIWEPHRSIVRDAMIEALTSQKLTDPNEWFIKIPGFLRAGTNPAEKKRYLDRICDIMERLK